MQNGRRKMRAEFLTGAVLLGSALLCDWLVLHYHAKKRYMDLKAAAKTVYLYAEDYRLAGHSPAEFAGEGCISAKDGGFSAYLAEDSHYLREGDHYAVVCDAQGQTVYVLYSHSRIADRYLESSPDTDMFTSVRTLQTPFLWRYTVVCYP